MFLVWNIFCFVLLVLSLTAMMIDDVDGVYSHAAFVNALRRDKTQVKRSGSIEFDASSDEYSVQMNNTALFGLPHCSSMQCQRIGIIGAGLSGLTIAYELTRAGHQVIVYEASDRAGGRLFTYERENTIIELGGMRLPLDVHYLMDTYIRKRFQLPLEPFISSDPKSFVYINGIHSQLDNTTFFPGQFQLNVNANETHQSPFVLWNKAIAELSHLFFSHGWSTVVRKYGSYNVRDYLKERGLSNAMIDYIGLLLGIETNLHTAILSHFRDALLINDETKFFHIVGGNHRLIEEFSKASFDIHYSHEVLEIIRHDNKRVHLVIKAGANVSESMQFDRVVVATSAPAARLIRHRPMNEQTQEMSRALRQLHYDCSSKIALYFSRPWWHDQQIYGGSSVTDLPLRFIYYDNYPTVIHRNQSRNESVLLASYTFAQDSTLWSSSTLDQITREALNNLEEIHSLKNLKNYHLRTVVKHWCADSFSHGAYALYLPDQEENLKLNLMKSFDRRVYFAGEHLSSAHAWFEGAILSGLGVLLQINQEEFDFVIVGGGLLALQLAEKMIDQQSTWKILLVEKNSFLSPFCSNQFQSSSANTTINDYLNFGPNLSNSALNSLDLRNQFAFENLPSNYRGHLNGKRDFVNTKQLIENVLNRLKEKKYSNITLAENEEFLSHSHEGILTNRRKIFVQRKIILLDNCYIHPYIEQSLKPSVLNILINEYLVLSFPSMKSNSSFTWSFHPNQLIGFHLDKDPPEKRVLLFHPSLSFALSWLEEHCSALLDITRLKYQANYKVTKLMDQGHIIDYLPNTNNQTIVVFGENHLDLYPVWIDIICNLIFYIDQPIHKNYSIFLPHRIRRNSSFRLSLSSSFFLLSFTSFYRQISYFLFA